MGSDRLGLIVHKLAERKVCAIGLKVDRTVPKHSNESAFQTSLPVGLSEQGKMEASAWMRRGNSILVLIYLFGLEFLNLLYPKAQLS